MTHKSHLLLVLMKIKNISQLFNHPIKSITTINYWPSRDALHQHLQSAFKSYKNCMYYWLCKSIYPKATKLFGSCYYLFQLQLHKFKHLIGISLVGAATFLSHGWGGQISNKQLTIESGLLNLLTFGNSILADKEFIIAEEVATRELVLAITCFPGRKSQMTVKDVDESRKNTCWKGYWPITNIQNCKFHHSNIKSRPFKWCYDCCVSLS